MVLLVGYSLLRLKSDDTGVPMFRPHQVVGKSPYECFSEFIYTHAQSKTDPAQYFFNYFSLSAGATGFDGDFSETLGGLFSLSRGCAG
jgi:hypothetical protein